jgi:hypothetical protein
MLDERVRVLLRGGGMKEYFGPDFNSGWQKRSEELYKAAVEIAKKLGK